MDLAWLLAPPLAPATPRRRVLYQRLRAAVLDGRLAPGTRLPASRQLAADLGIARNTVLHAYEQLVAEGCLAADRHGTRVAGLRAAMDGVPRPAGAIPGTAGGTRQTVADGRSVRGVATATGTQALSRRALAALPAEPVDGGDALPFAPGVPDLAAFPFRAWRGCLERAWRQATPRQLGYSPPGGDPALRAAVASHLATARGMAVAAEQVVITAGTQNALDLCARLLADAGDTAWVENPGYLAARSALSLAGLALHPIVVDDDGLAPGEEDWVRHPPRLVVVTPSHQYPSGRVLSLPRRLALLDRAEAAGAWIVEDDYDSELRTRGAGLPALHGLRPDAPVIYAGTFSKTLYPGLRLGYLVVPAALAQAFARAAGEATRPGQGIEQRALADFIQRGHYTSHLRRMRRRYGARQALLRDALARHLGKGLAVSGGSAGVHLCLWLPSAIADVAVAKAAARRGLLARPLSRYALPPLACNGLVLGYGATEERLIEPSVRLLRFALDEAAAGLAG